MWESYSENIVDQLIRESDDTVMPLPSMESEPHLLISKVRKHYMDYVIKLLAVNYESNLRLSNKNIKIPSAIWRCAKQIESQAARTCMVTQLYRKQISAEIKQLKTDTKKGKLNRKLYDCLHKAPENEKNMQTSLNSVDDCTCQCTCSSRKGRRKLSDSSRNQRSVESEDNYQQINEISSNLNPVLNSDVVGSTTNIQVDIVTQNKHSHLDLPGPTPETPVHPHDSDDLLMQLEKLFQADSNDDDIFDGGLCDTKDYYCDDKASSSNQTLEIVTSQNNDVTQSNVPPEPMTLEDRLASLSGMLVNSNSTDSSLAQRKLETKEKCRSSKWHCEEYFLKIKFFELLDGIGETNRKKLARVKGILTELFGDDSDDEGVTSPLEETPEFVLSCKERIAPMVVKLLTPYYIKGRIIGKSLFKALAKHLIKLIYQCSQYPQEYEVCSFVTDFLKNHKMIRCEADFLQFRIQNI